MKAPDRNSESTAIQSTTGGNMNTIAKRALALAFLASIAVATVPSYSADSRTSGEAAKNLMKMCDESSDGTVTKEQVMKSVERMFDKRDTAKTGKLTKNQLQLFLDDYARYPGG
jgi:hypothetical protein